MGREYHFLADGPAGPHKIAYREWGDSNTSDVVVCAHGLTRNSRDFDKISKVLSEDYRVLCVDIAGRGNSDWLDDPQHYAYPQYVIDAHSLLTHLGITQVNWLGTSMGGILGMLMAAMPDSPVQKLIINDIGPFIPSAALRRISNYVGKAPKFSSIEAVNAYLREVHAPFGPLTDQQWAHLANHSAKQDIDGDWTLNYDPAIAEPFKKIDDQDIDLWEVWDNISCPTLILRGETSDVLPLEIAHQARTRGPMAELHQFGGTGHAPALMAIEQIQIVRQWLRR